MNGNYLLSRPKLFIKQAETIYRADRNYLLSRAKLFIEQAETIYWSGRSYLLSRPKLLLSRSKLFVEHAETVYWAGRNYLLIRPKLYIKQAETIYSAGRKCLLSGPKPTNSCSEEKEVLEINRKLICVFCMYKAKCLYSFVERYQGCRKWQWLTALLRCLGAGTDAATKTWRLNFHFKQETINEIQIFNYYY